MLAWLPPLLSASSAVPKSAPRPCVIGLQWSMAADEVLWHTDRNTRGSGTNKKKKRAHSFLGASSPTLSRCEVHAGALTVECVHTSMLLSLRRCLCCLTWYFFSSFQAADYSVSALGNVILAPLFVVLMYLESPPPPPPSTPPLGQQLFFISLWKLVKCYRVRVSRAAQEGAGCVD